MQKNAIDLRSDTITKPTQEMLEAMREAKVGDDVYGEDPTINRLEEIAALRTGMEAALFVPSGTMGNTAAILTHTQRGDEVLLEAESHILLYEVGGLSSIGGVMPRLVIGKYGIMSGTAVERAIRPYNIHFPNPSLICVENTHNMAGGTVMSPQQLGEVRKIANKYKLALHMDGARVFNAAVALGVDVKELTEHVDSVMFCLSKGLSAPVGSLLAGSQDFIEKARKYRKMLGGGMRQAGYLAAAGIVALEKMVDRLHEDHANARGIGEGVSRIPGVNVNLDTVQTNMVNVDFAELGLDADEAVAKLSARGIKVNGRPPHTIRMVTHRHISSVDVDYVIASVKEIACRQ